MSATNFQDFQGVGTSGIWEEGWVLVEVIRISEEVSVVLKLSVIENAHGERE